MKTDISKIGVTHREELDRLLEQRRAAEDAAAKRHGIDIDKFMSLLDRRISHDPTVLAIQAEIDAIYGRITAPRYQVADTVNGPFGDVYETLERARAELAACVVAGTQANMRDGDMSREEAHASARAFYCIVQVDDDGDVVGEL